MCENNLIIGENCEREPYLWMVTSMIKFIAKNEDDTIYYLKSIANTYHLRFDEVCQRFDVVVILCSDGEMNDEELENIASQVVEKRPSGRIEYIGTDQSDLKIILF